MGVCPDNLKSTPEPVITYVANQLDVNPNLLSNYGHREQTRSDHLLRIADYLGFRKASEADFVTLSRWLLHRALEHDKPTLLFHLACQKLRNEKIIRPGVTIVERLVQKARDQAIEETYDRLNTLITNPRKVFLDSLLNKEEGRTPLY